MANRGYSRLLITWALAAALSAVFVPALRAGEPDFPPQAPPPVKLNLLPTGGVMSTTGGGTASRSAGQRTSVRAESGWVLQLRWSVQALLVQIPKRFP